MALGTWLPRCALLTLAGVATTANSADWIWRYLPQFQMDQERPPVHLDLDGDGTDEIVLRSPSHQGLIGVLGQTDDGLALVDVHVTSASFAPFVAVPVSAGAPGRLLTTSRHAILDTTRLTELSGVPLRVVAEKTFGFRVRPWLLADIDGDGDEELVDFDTDASPAAVRVFDYSTGEMEWSYPMPQTPGGSLSALQLDDDAALEIVVVGSLPGLVLDGATGSLEWSHPQGFGREFHSGRFHEKADVPTFATRGTSVQVFRGRPLERLTEFTVSTLPGAHGSGSVHDVNGDGVDDLVMAPYFQTTSFRAFDMRSGQQIGAWPSAFPNSTAAGFGRTSPGSHLLLTHGSSPPFGTGALGVESKTFPHGEVQYRRSLQAGPFNIVAAGDVDGDGQREIVLLARNAASHPAAETASVLVFENEESQPSAALPLSYAAARMTLAELNGLPGEEIVVAGPLEVAVLDGATLEVNWERRFDAQTDLAGFSPVALSSTDFDGDGVADVALLVDDVWGGNRVVALSGLDGHTLWISQAMPGIVHERSLVIGQFDTDPAMEVIVTSQMTMHIFDAISKQQQWVMQPNGWTLKSAALIHEGHTCRLGLIGSELLRLYDCFTRILVGSATLPHSVDAVRQLDPTNGLLVYSDMDRIFGLMRAAGGYFRYPLTSRSGARLSTVTERMVAGSTGDGSVDLLVGTPGFPAMIRVDLAEVLMRGDFEG